MSTGTTKAPALPLAPLEYSHQYQDQLNNILRLYFSQLDNPGASAGSTQRTPPSTVIAALNFSQVDQNNQRVVSFPTEDDVAAGSLRVGDVYYDRTDGNVLKILTAPVIVAGLTGVNAACSVGTTTRGADLSGVGSVGAVGTVGGTITLSLTGVSSVGAVGTVTP